MNDRGPEAENDWAPPHGIPRPNPDDPGIDTALLFWGLIDPADTFDNEQDTDGRRPQ